MKKIAFVLVLVVGIMTVFSCKSTAVTGVVTDETFKKIYDKYSGDLILDGAKSYTVKSGDSLSKISTELYGDGYYYPVIMLASKDVVLDQDKIQPDMKLVVPDLKKNMDSPKAKSSIKGVIQDCAKIEDDRGRKDTAKGLRDHAAKL